MIYSLGYKILYAACFALLILTIGYGIAYIFGFTITEFWAGYLIATGSNFGVDVYQAIHYKLVKRK